MGKSYLCLAMIKDDRIGLSGVVLSGGKCLRMGSDKAFCQFEERDMIRFGIGLLEGFCDEIIISANAKGYEDLGYKVVADTYRGAGPMAGLHAAITAASHEQVLVLSCDMPLAHPDILSALLQHTGRADAVVPTHEGWIEPLSALYHKNILPSVETALKSGHFKLMDLLAGVNTLYLAVDDIISGLPRDPFANINTPADLAFYQRKLS